MAWAVEFLLNGDVQRCEDWGNGFPVTGLKSDDKMVWGLVQAKDRDEVLDKVTAFMAKLPEGK